MVPQRSQSGRVWRGLLAGFFLGGLAAALIVAVGFKMLEGLVSTGLEGSLRKYIFNGPHASFGALQVDLLRGRFKITDLVLKRSSFSFSVPEIQGEVPLGPLLSGRGVVGSIDFRSPLLEGAFSFRARGVGGRRDLRVSGISKWLRRLPVAQVTVTNGQVHLVHRDSGGTWGLRKLNLRAIQEEGASGRFGVSAEAINEQQAPGSFALDLTADARGSALVAEGNGSFTDWPLDPLAGFLSGTGDARVTDGRLNLKTRVTCKDHWVTADHRVDVADFKAEISSKRTEILGVPVRWLKELMDIPSLSFVISTAGPVMNPSGGAAQGIEQVLLKILAPKIKDKKELERVAHRGGEFIGAKVDRLFRPRPKD